MTAVVPATGGEGDRNEGAVGKPSDGATTLSDAQRRWCIGAAVVVMGLASLGTALYQSQSADVDPTAADALAPLETSSSGSAGGPGSAPLPDPSLGAMGAPSADALAPLSLLPSPAVGGGIPAGAGLPAYVAPSASAPRVVDSPAAPLGSPLASPAAPPGASLPAQSSAAPAGGPGTGTTVPPGSTGIGAGGAGSPASPYRQTSTPGVIEVAPGQAPPPGYRRVYPGPPRQPQAGTAQQQRTTPGTATTPRTQRTTPNSRTAPDGTTSPNGTGSQQQRRSPSTTSDDASGSGSSTTPSGRTAPRSESGLLGGLGGR